MAAHNGTTADGPTPEQQFVSIADLYAQAQPMAQPQPPAQDAKPDAALYVMIGIVILLLVKR